MPTRPGNAARAYSTMRDRYASPVESGYTAAIASGSALRQVREPPRLPSPPMKWSTTTQSATSAIDACEEGLRVRDRQERRDRDDHAHARRTQLGRRREAVLDRARRRREAGQPVTVALDRHVHTERTALCQPAEWLLGVHHAGAVRVHDQRVRRILDHGLEHATRHAVARLLGNERIGRARQEDPESAPCRPCPAPFTRNGRAVHLVSVLAHLEKTPPGPPTRDQPIMPHITTHAAQGPPVGAPPIRLQRMRAHIEQIPRSPRQNGPHPPSPYLDCHPTTVPPRRRPAPPSRTRRSQEPEGTGSRRGYSPSPSGTT